LPSQGSVITRVYTSDAYIPLQNVPVLYSQTDENGDTELLRVLLTDSSGLTEPYYLQTPDAERSLVPGSISRPYTTIDISISYPGYNAVRAEGIQIFPNVQTIQDFQLRPVPATAHEDAVTYIDGTQNL